LAPARRPSPGVWRASRIPSIVEPRQLVTQNRSPSALRIGRRSIRSRSVRRKQRGVEPAFNRQSGLPLAPPRGQAARRRRSQLRGGRSRSRGAKRHETSTRPGTKIEQHDIGTSPCVHALEGSARRAQQPFERPRRRSSEAVLEPRHRSDLSTKQHEGGKGAPRLRAAPPTPFTTLGLLSRLASASLCRPAPTPVDAHPPAVCRRGGAQK